YNSRQPTFNKTHAREPERVGRDRRARRRSHPRQERPKQNRGDEDRRAIPLAITLPLTLRFLPNSRVFENVVAQIKSGSVAYSIFALARLFLEKPERYEVRLTAKEGSPLYQLGENREVS